MILRNHIFKKVTIVGVGLMGGSFGMALKKHQLAREIVGLSQKPATLSAAIKNKSIDVGVTDVVKAIHHADLVVLAAPVDSIIKAFKTINPYLKRGCVITDLGSTKVEIIESSEKHLSAPGFFVGSHPLAGSEKKGVDFASAELFENSCCIMTPTKNTNPVAKEKIKYLWTRIGAKVTFMSAEEHDEILAYISHLPHLLAYGLMETIPPKFHEFTPQGLKDLTRIASSPPQIWNDICMSNSRNILVSIDELVKRLSYYRKAIVNRDQKNLIDHFTKAKELRDGIC